MADVAVVGAGIGGMAVAARLAKLGHRVTVFEREPAAGGNLRRVEQDGFRWDAGAPCTGLPAALRDLFRTSGRPIERYLDLVPSSGRRHLFADGTTVDLPTGSRAGQIRALDHGLGSGAGRHWAAFVDGQEGVWDSLRQSPSGPDWDPKGGPARPGPLPVRRSLRRMLARELPDVRLRDLVSQRYVLAGSDLDDVPAVAAVGAYVDRSFGLWRCPTGLAAITDALMERLRERGVEVRYDTPVRRIVLVADRVSAVETADESRGAADLVVAAMDPLVVFECLLARRQSRAAKVFRAQRRVDPPAVTHLGLRGLSSGDPADELVLHGDPPLLVSTIGTAPAGHAAWTVWRRGSDVDVLAVLAARGLDVRDRVVTRLDRTPQQVLSEPGGSSYAMAWDGWRTYRRRSAFAEPTAGLHVLPASLTPGATIPQVLWTAAHIANRIGKA
jgi:phytoene dehydrogenase-like protein